MAELESKVLWFGSRDADASYWAHRVRMMLDYYQVLGVGPDADAASLRTAYRRRAKLLHPDRHVGQTADVVAEATRAMAELTEALAILSDTRRRLQYDHARSGGSRDSSDPDSSDDEPQTVADMVVEALLSTMYEILDDADQPFDSAAEELARFIMGVAVTQLEAALDIVRQVTVAADEYPYAVAYVAVGMAVDLACSDVDMLGATPPKLGAFGALLRTRIGAELDEAVLMSLPRMSPPPAPATANGAAGQSESGASGESGEPAASGEEAGSVSSSAADITGEANDDTAIAAIAVIAILILILVAVAGATSDTDTQPAPSASSPAISTASPTPPSATPWVARQDCLVQSADGDLWQPVSCSRQHDAVIVSVHSSETAARCPDSGLAFDDDWGAYCAAIS
jgi:hypothetical protein